MLLVTSVTLPRVEDESQYAEHLQGREYQVAFIMNKMASSGITLVGPGGKGWLFEKVIMVDGGAEINAIVRDLAVNLG